MIQGYDPVSEFVLGIAWPEGKLGVYLLEPEPSPPEAALLRRAN